MHYSYEAIMKARDEVDHAESGYLRERGWEYTCSTPGSVWRWAKRIKRRVLVMSQGDAVYAQGHLGDKD